MNLPTNSPDRSEQVSAGAGSLMDGWMDGWDGRIDPSITHRDRTCVPDPSSWFGDVRRTHSDSTRTKVPIKGYLALEISDV